MGSNEEEQDSNTQFHIHSASTKRHREGMKCKLKDDLNDIQYFKATSCVPHTVTPVARDVTTARSKYTFNKSILFVEYNINCYRYPKMPSNPQSLVQFHGIGIPIGIKPLNPSMNLFPVPSRSMLQMLLCKISIFLLKIL